MDDENARAALQEAAEKMHKHSLSALVGRYLIDPLSYNPIKVQNIGPCPKEDAQRIFSSMGIAPRLLTGPEESMAQVSSAILNRKTTVQIHYTGPVPTEEQVEEARSQLIELIENRDYEIIND